MSKMSLSVDPRYGKPAQALALAATPLEVKEIETLAAAAKRYAQSLEDRNYAAEIQLRAGRKGGQLLIEMAGTGQRRTRADGASRKVGQPVAPSLADLAIEPKRAERWQWLARLPESRFESYIAQTKAEAEPLTVAGLGEKWQPASGLMSSDSVEWYTPLPVIERVIAVLGEIDLDPCSNATGEPRVPAIEHFTAEDDGLSRPWRGRVYMNPPYGREIGAWVDKLAEEFESGSVPEAIALVPARTDTSWWAHLPAGLVCFVTGRLTFSDHDNPAPFPSAACYLGTNNKRFAEEFLTLGLVYVRLETEAAA